jgi:hypothetical protein
VTKLVSRGEARLELMLPRLFLVSLFLWGHPSERINPKKKKKVCVEEKTHTRLTEKSRGVQKNK